MCIILLRTVSGYFTVNPKKCLADVYSVCVQRKFFQKLVYVVELFGEVTATRGTMILIKYKAR